MKRYPLVVIIVVVSLGLLIGGLLAAQAGDCDGTPGNDVINCTVNPTNPDAQVDGDLGDDNITVATGVTVDFIDADGETSGADNKGAGNGGNDTIVNNGTVNVAISGDYVTGAGGNDTITNNGTVGTIYGDEAAGTVTSSGDDNITNNGTVVNDIIADDNATAGGNDTVTNNGTIGGTIDAGGGNDVVTNNSTGSVNNINAGNGNDNVTNNGTVNGTIDAGDGNNNVTNSGTVGAGITSGNGTDTINNSGSVTGSIDAGDGNNSVTNDGSVSANIVTGVGTDMIVNNGSVSGSISAGDGNDTVDIGDGATVGGTIDGGAGTDTLQFHFNDPAVGAAAAATLAGMSPAGGTATFGGHTYTWSNFEQLRAIFAAAAASGQTVTVSVAQIKDGRINGYDLGAPIAVYCVPDEYIEVIDIRQDGSNPLAFRVAFDIVNKAVKKAKSTFDYVNIASGQGDYLSAVQNGSLVAYGPTFDATKIYKFTFQPDCSANKVGTEG
ncbi:MAG: hypothetical protein GC179_01160 [Anaerolineaceae bacterium]|nr:hypothetical protein [Anaerolineaceae bacterium]